MDLDEIREHQVNDALDAHREPFEVAPPIPGAGAPQQGPLETPLYCPRCEEQTVVLPDPDGDPEALCTTCGHHESEENFLVAPRRLASLSAKGNELLKRARVGSRLGKVEPALMRDIDSVLLDGAEHLNEQIEAELEVRGA